MLLSKVWRAVTHLLTTQQGLCEQCGCTGALGGCGHRPGTAGRGQAGAGPPGRRGRRWARLEWRPPAAVGREEPQGAAAVAAPLQPWVSGAGRAGDEGETGREAAAAAGPGLGLGRPRGAAAAPGAASARGLSAAVGVSAAG